MSCGNCKIFPYNSALSRFWFLVLWHQSVHLILLLYFQRSGSWIEDNLAQFSQRLVAWHIVAPIANHLIFHKHKILACHTRFKLKPTMVSDLVRKNQLSLPLDQGSSFFLKSWQCSDTEGPVTVCKHCCINHGYLFTDLRGRDTLVREATVPKRHCLPSQVRSLFRWTVNRKANRLSQLTPSEKTDRKSTKYIHSPN